MIGERWCLMGEEVVIKQKAMWRAHVMRQGGLPCAVIDGLPTVWVRVGAEVVPNCAGLDNVTKWTGRSVDELRNAAIEREQVMAASPVMRPITV